MPSRNCYFVTYAGSVRTLAEVVRKKTMNCRLARTDVLECDNVRAYQTDSSLSTPLLSQAGCCIALHCICNNVLGHRLDFIAAVREVSCANCNLHDDGRLKLKKKEENDDFRSYFV